MSDAVLFYCRRCPKEFDEAWKRDVHMMVCAGREPQFNEWRATPPSNLDVMGRVALALQIAAKDGPTDGAHHKAWVIDQMVRALTADRYAEFVAAVTQPEGRWDVGIAP